MENTPVYLQGDPACLQTRAVDIPSFPYHSISGGARVWLRQYVPYPDCQQQTRGLVCRYSSVSIGVESCLGHRHPKR